MSVAYVLLPEIISAAQSE